MLNINTVMLRNIRMSAKLLLYFGLHLNLMLKCKHKDLPKVLIIVGKNEGLWDVSQKNGIFEQTGSKPLDKPNYGTTF